MAIERLAALTFVWLGALLFAVSLAVFLHAYLVTFGRPAPSGPAARDTLVNIALFSVFALHHSVLARAPAKALVARIVSPEVERSVYVWTASILFIGVCLLWRALPGDLYRFTGWTAAVFYGMQIAAILLTVSASSVIGIRGLAGLRSIVDERSVVHVPRREDTRHVPLRTSGLYGLVRHPLYFAWFLLVFSTPHMTMTRLVFAVVSTAYLALAIPFEERGLISVFGNHYREYQDKVRWRMLPGIY